MATNRPSRVGAQFANLCDFAHSWYATISGCERPPDRPGFLVPAPGARRHADARRLDHAVRGTRSALRRLPRPHRSRLHLVPRFRQKVRFVPFGQGRPVWVDDPHLNLAYHVRHTSLPEPGTEQQLRVLAARIFSEQLDRSKPLWELWLIEGLKGGRFAIVGKTHHAMVDGVSGVDITTVLFDAEKEPAESPQALERWVPRPEPNGAQLLGEALLERTIYPREIARGLRRIARGPRRALEKAAEMALAAGTFAWTGSPPPEPLQLRHRHPSPFRVGAGLAGRHEAGQERTRRDRQRRHPDRRRRGARPLPALSRPSDRRGRAARDGPGKRAHRRAARRARQPGDRDDGDAPGLVRGPEAANGDRAPVDGRPEGVEAGDGCLPAHATGRLRAHDHRRAGRPSPVATAVLQPRRHQHPRPAVPALPDGPPHGARLPDGPPGQEPGRLHRDHELRRAGQLRADRRLRRDDRSRGSRQGPRDSIDELLEAAGGRPGLFRRFLPREGVDSAERNGGGEREESPAG